MSIVINPSVSHIAAQGATAAPIVLQSGSVITARVLQAAGNSVQIAINGHAINVLSQVPLQAGQTLQLAVSQTADGVRLAVVDQQPASGPNGTTSASSASVTADTVTLAPSAVASIAPQTTSAVAAPTVQLTPQEALAVSVAAQSAATQQTGLAPLFANLNVAAGLNNLPPQVQQAVAQLLSQQLNLDQNLTGNAIKQAFQTSGLFLEASLASGSVSASTAAPDLKAALIVLRQVLTTSLASTAAQTPATPPVVGSQGAAQPVAVPASANAVPTASAATMLQGAAPAAALTAEAATVAAIVVEQGTGQIIQASTQPAAITVVQGTQATASLAPVLASEIAAAQVSLAAAATAVVQDVVNFGAVAQIVAPASTATDAAALAAASGAAINLLQEALQAEPMIAGIPSQLLLNNASMLSLLPAATGVRTLKGDDADVARTNVPPPPISGAVPTAQPVVPATLLTNSPAETAMHHLLADADGAIARQVLLQVASLPERTDASGVRVEAGASHWNFEIPFATPQGTAMAQFEISRDGGGNEVAATKRMWRARFSLDVEPAGPVHALISYSGERTSVRMWAERPATVAQMRAGAAELGQALSRAELQPGDIVVHEGTPPQSAAAKAGHFLDRAL
jgi:hypothetical protein